MQLVMKIKHIFGKNIIKKVIPEIKKRINKRRKRERLKLEPSLGKSMKMIGKLMDMSEKINRKQKLINV
jgi:DNA gyrase/topoisomerase IV subunit B